jgi:hypothetical protein
MAEEATPAPIRASDAEREATMDALRDGAAEGRLSFEELADRLEGAAGARTRDELAGLTADLPAGHPSGAPATWRPGAPVEADDRTPARRSSVFGDVVQDGAWRVPDVGRWSAVFGDVTIDLREALVSHPRIEVEASSVFGDVTLLVPEGVLVEVRSKTFFGDVKKDAGHRAPPGAPVVVLTGGTWFGDVRVRAVRLRERLAHALLGRPRPGVDAGGRAPGLPDPGRPGSGPAGDDR